MIFTDDSQTLLSGAHNRGVCKEANLQAPYEPSGFLAKVSPFSFVSHKMGEDL